MSLSRQVPGLQFTKVIENFAFSFRLSFLVVACASAFQQTPIAFADTPPGDRDQALIAEVDALIEQLGSPSYRVREQAKWKLERIGLPAFGQLRKAVADPNIQIANAVNYLLRSQRVVWWLPSDSFEVRNLVDNYNELNSDQRKTRLSQLRELGTADALLALCRFAKFESDEQLSKIAALELMQRIAESPSKLPLNFIDSIGPAIGTGERSAITWLRECSKSLGDDKVDIDAWRKLAAKEKDDADDADDLRVSLRLYKWLGTFLTQRVGREAAISVVVDISDLVGSGRGRFQSGLTTEVSRLVDLARWAIASDLPELATIAYEKHKEVFDEQHQLLFLAAEAFRKQERMESAEELFIKASAIIDERALREKKSAKSLPSETIAANLHSRAAQQLNARGLFDWAEREYLQALKVINKAREAGLLNTPISFNIENGIRNELAEFYWYANEPRKAANALEPLVTSEEYKATRGLPGSSFADQSQYYYYYLGLALVREGKVEDGFENLEASLELDENPDVVIAMYEGAKADSDFKSRFDSAFNDMASEFRMNVANSERELANAPSRMKRNMAANSVATACNELAWLLGKCEQSAEEAVMLSERSLELIPDEPAFLDTLSRCYFSAGRIDDAIETQKKAVELSPGDRLMQIQLEEYKAAKNS